MKKEYSKVLFRKRRTLTADSKTCSGCQTCGVICSLLHEGAVDLALSRIYVKDNAFAGSFVPVVCHQCPDAPCLYSCPEGAMEIDPGNGVILIAEEKCTGCGQCSQACPFQVIRLDEGKKKARKCDLCKGDPQCLQWCPTNALGIAEFGGDIPK